MSRSKRKSSKDQAELQLDARRLVRAILILGPSIAVLLLLVDWYAVVGLGARSKGLRHLFDSAREDGLGSFYGVTLTVFVALTLWGIVLAVRARAPEDRRRVLGWSVLAAAFSYIAVDDGAQLHERLSSWLQGRLFTTGAEGSALGRLLDWFPSYSWQVLFLPVFGLLGIFMLVFLHRELKASQPRRLIVAALALWAVALGIDFCEGLDASSPLSLKARLMTFESVRHQAVDVLGTTPEDVADHLTKSVEEALEVAGVCLFLAAFLAHFLSLAEGLRVRVSGLQGMGRNDSH